MVTIDISGTTMTVEVNGWHVVWALRKNIEVPLSSIKRVAHARDTTLGWAKGIRAPGTHVPGYIVAGTYYQDGKRIFWDVMNPENTVVIDLEGEHFQQLVVEVDNPAQTVEMIKAALA